jgi:hypothetical protein
MAIQLLSGQVWVSVGRRNRGRRVQIEHLATDTLINQRTAPVAICTVLTDCDKHAAVLGSPSHRSAIGRTVVIEMRQFDQNSYRLISQPKEST